VIVLLGALSGAHASSLDLIEVGGAWGSPGATDATAVWWNPAGLAAGRGTRYTLEVAPTFATVTMNRTNPGYARDPNNDNAFGPDEADYGGLGQYKRTAVVPYVGIASDFGQKGLGIGLALAVPHGRGAAGAPDQVTRYHLVEGGNQAIYALVSGAYQFEEKVAIGVSGAFVDSSYTSNLFTETGTALNDGIKEQLNSDDDFYADTMLEDPDYSAHVVTDGQLKDTAITFGAGIHVQPNDKVAFALAYRHGLRVDHEGTATLTFGCPSTDDFLGRFGAESQGICNSVLGARQTVGYDLPKRVHGSIVVTPKDGVRLEAMGGWVGWSVFQDYEIGIIVDPETVPLDDPDAQEETAGLVSQQKLWARDNRDSFWLAADGKFDVHERVLIGARILYDKAAVPTETLSTNNYDANTVSLTGLVVGKVAPGLEIGLSATQYIASQRVNEFSSFGLTMYENRKDARYFYPSMNGTYTSSITRIGVSLRGAFDHGKASK
jgi:long-subunit fatty acid transport protein